MANDVSGLLQQGWSKGLQAYLEESLVVSTLANRRLQPFLKGKTVHVPRMALNKIQAYTKYSDITFQDLSSSDETLTLDTTPVVPFAIDEVDEAEQSYDIRGEALQRAAFKLKQYIEGQFFAQYSNAKWNAGSTITLSATSTDAGFPVTVFGRAKAVLSKVGVDVSNLAIVLDPLHLEVIQRGVLGNTFSESDATYKMGYRGKFLGCSLYESSNLSGSATLAVASQPADGYVIKINGVTFTAKTTLGTTAGNVLLGADAAAFRANLIAAINGAAGAGSTYVEIGQDNRNQFIDGVTASESSTNVVLASRRGAPYVESTNTAAVDWQDIVSYALVMEKGAIDLVMGKEVGIKESDSPKQIGKLYKVWAHFGIKTFTEGAQRMYYVAAKTQADEA
jgi:hypothetical protein